MPASLYALSDIDAGGRRFGFFPFLMFLMAGVTGAFLTGDIFNLYVWFEVLLISSFGLLVLGSEREQIDGAMKYAVLNLIGTTLFLIAVGYLYAIFGTLNMADIALKAAGLRDTAPLMTLAALFLLAFAMKAAAFPVNFWLPASYHTPRIVVSALFAGLLTKVGIYALIRVMVMLLPVEREALSLMIARRRRRDHHRRRARRAGADRYPRACSATSSSRASATCSPAWRSARRAASAARSSTRCTPSC